MMLLNVVPLLIVLIQVLFSCQATVIDIKIPEHQKNPDRTVRSLRLNDARHSTDPDSLPEGYWDPNSEVSDYDVYDDGFIADEYNVGYESARLQLEKFLLKNLYGYLSSKVLPMLTKTEDKRSNVNRGRRPTRPMELSRGRAGYFRPFNKCKRGKVGVVSNWVYGC